MKITVLGGTGGVGTHVVDLLLERGHDVTVLARDPAKVKAGDRVRVVQGDAFDAQAVSVAVDGQDAVISALGSTQGPGQETSLRRMADSLARAVEAGRVSRVVWCASEGIDGEIPGVVGKLAMWMLRKPLADHRAALDRLEQAGAALTVARPRALNDDLAEPDYTEVVDGPADGAWAIPRASVAHFLVKATEDDSYSGKSVALAKPKT